MSWRGGLIAVGVVIAVITGSVLVDRAGRDDLTCQQPQPSPAAQLNPSTRMPGHQVWGHYIGQGLPNWDRLDGSAYGDHYYLDLVRGDENARQRPTAYVPRAQAAGLTGMQVLLGTSNDGSDFVTEWFASADPTWASSDPTQHFAVAPVLADMTKARAVTIIEQYAKAAQGHPSAAKLDSKLVVFLYGGRTHMSAQDWQTVRQTLDARSVQVYLIGDILPETSRNQDRVPTAQLIPYLRAWDASWLFEAETPKYWPTLAAMINQVGKPFAGGVMPGYNRETAGGGYEDARGTGKLREEWQLGLSSGATWQTVVTWNDLVENSEVIPTSTWNTTRSDVNAFYAAKLMGKAAPFSDARLYITSPKFVRVGDQITAEGLILNGGSKPAQVEVTLVDGAGHSVGAPVTGCAAAGESGAATTRTQVTAVPSGGFVRAHAMLKDARGRVVREVTGAPVLVYPKTQYIGSDMRRTYYSIPADKALGANPTLKVSGTPARAGASSSASVTTPNQVNARFVDVIQNTREVQRGYDTSSLRAKVPLANGSVLVGGQRVSSAPYGYYVARVIDDQERVGYSDPVAVSR